MVIYSKKLVVCLRSLIFKIGEPTFKSKSLIEVLSLPELWSHGSRKRRRGGSRLPDLEYTGGVCHG